MIYLRDGKREDNGLFVRIETPGGNIQYEMKTLKLQDYSIEELFEKRLFLLLPFSMFLFERDLTKYETDEDALKELENTFGNVVDRLNGLALAGDISEYQRTAIIDMVKKTNYNLTRNEPRVRKGVEAVMGGHVLDYPAKRAYKQAVAEGLAEGMAQGMAQGMEKGKLQERADLVNHVLSIGNTVEQTAALLGLSEEEVRKLSQF